MTAFGAFQRTTDPRFVTFFADFIGDVKPFGTSLSSNVLGTATVTLSNTNDSALGTATLTLPTTQSGLTAVSRAGIQLAESTSTNGAILRNFRPDRSDYVEARVKANHTASLVKCTVGFILDHAVANTTQPSVAENFAGFWARGGDDFWTAGVGKYNNLLGSKTTVARKNEWNVLSVQSLEGGRTFIFYANGDEVWRYSSANPLIVGEDGVPIPCVEIRDKTGGGAGAGTHSVVVDYILVNAERKLI